MGSVLSDDAATSARANPMKGDWLPSAHRRNSPSARACLEQLDGCFNYEFGDWIPTKREIAEILPLNDGTGLRRWRNLRLRLGPEKNCHEQ